MVQGLEFMVWLAKLARGQPEAELNLASLEDGEPLLGAAGWRPGASLESPHYSHVEMLGSRYMSVNFGARKTPE